ncbi:MAG: hypothetical protein PHD88_09385 [Firmicutes bacterium]|nr:hypothetical protein [Bacillota bacterium]MDD4264480.1 hypothetical protein [Bacillota bacterium]MDD4694585.1 hypothetical protein [Bacillota bacterium]
MKRNKLLFIVLAFMVMLVLAGCIPGDGKNTEENPAGFFWGVWHGWVAPISLIIGIFKNNITIYETFNTGWWYDFGFYMAIISGFGSISLFRKKGK